ncbi:unnamed protein product [Spirodela intermedia]|uniref:Uncharacterized protein n=1 Tax=Spirodela intermedia TaxID=51605 RepID=A0A7I8L2F5_SPIIN|nr:unnamed protein product [Spirodela intermedia]
MAVSGDPKLQLLLLPPFASHLRSPSRSAFHLPSSCSKVRFGSGRASHIPFMRTRCRCSVIGRRNQFHTATAKQETEGFILNAVAMNFFERLHLAWRILFPTAMARSSSNANIAKQRLKMILFSDRCAVSDEAKQKILSKITDALSDFIEIDSQDKIQLSVSTDLDLGTVCSVTIPVRRVKPGYGDDDEYRGITNVEYMDTGDESGLVDVRFEFFMPGEDSFGL